MMRRRPILWIVLGAIALAGAFAGWATSDDEEGRWVPVERRDVVEEVELSGELRAVRSTDLGPPALRDLWNFKLSFLAPEGEVVEEGQPVMGFDTSELQPRLLQAMAERDRAATALEKARRDLEVARRNQELALAEARARARKAGLKTDVPEDVVSRQELRIARLDLALAEAEIAFREEQLESQRETAQVQLGGLEREHRQAVSRVGEIEQQIAQMTVRAPRTGTVVYKTNWRGEKKKVGESVWRQETVLQIPDLEEMEVGGTVDEASAGKLEIGQRVRFRIDAKPEALWTGVVQHIQGAVQQRSWRDRRKVVRLVVALDRSDADAMRPGMRIQGSIEVDRHPGVLALPLEAIQHAPEGPGVWVRDGFGRRWLTPEIGRRSGEWVEVAAGLEEGERVWVPSTDVVESAT